MTRHGRHGAQTEALDDAFIDRHAVVGPPAECVEKLQSLAGLGLSRLVLMLPWRRGGEASSAYEAAVKEVLPTFARP